MQHKSFTPDFRGMLYGLRVIDLSRVVAGNMLTLQLADHGAEDRKSTRLNSSHRSLSRMPSSA